MNIKLYIFIICVIFILWFLVFRYIIKRKFLLKYSLIWLLAIMVLSILAIQPQSLIWLSQVLGFESGMNVLYVFAILFLVLISISLTVIVTGQFEKIKCLTQTCALLDMRVKELENEKGKNI